MEVSERQSQGKGKDCGSQQEDIKKPAELRLLFSKEIKTWEDFSVCSLPVELGDIFVSEQDQSGYVFFSDRQSRDKWGFHLRISEKAKAPDNKYTFDQGWLQFVQAKDLDVGDSVIFHHHSDINQFYIDHLARLWDPVELFPKQFRYLTLFPVDYEISRDTLLQLYQAVGLLKGDYFTSTGQDSDVATFLDSFQFFRYLSWAREDKKSGKLFYKVSSLAAKRDFALNGSCLRVDLDDPNFCRNFLSANLEKLQHVTVWHLPTNVQVFEVCKNLRTLWFLNGHQSHVNHVPDGFFTALKFLRVLNSSRTSISELPSSIGHVRGLRYLDLSETPIKNLPRTIGHLQELQTLKLQNCRHLIVLPKHTTRLKKLQHLDLGAHCNLHCMPPGIGALTRLRTLTLFLVGTESGCSIAELGTLNLQGQLRLSRIQNVTNSEEAKEANLSQKTSLRSLELQWSPSQNQKSRTDSEVIEYLQPNTNLKYLQVLCFGGSKFPSWISDPSFTNLVSITLLKCENCQILPSLGRLLSLESLTLDELIGIQVIDYHFCRGIANIDDENDDVAFPKLKNLALVSLLSLEEWKDVRKIDFPSLLQLEMKDCPNLVAICSLSDVYRLQHLEISNCPLLPSLPEGLLPASVKELVIEDCPLLKSSCSKTDGEDWHKIEHVGSIWIDYEDISSL